MKKILLSLGMILFVGVVAAGATGAFFSDTETSTGNTFTAGAIDLKIDNTSYAIDFTIPGYTSPVGALVASPNNTWTLNDLTDQLFFNFVDLKPGDIGEDTISIHVNNNDAWLCMSTEITATPENGVTEPEGHDDTTTGTDEGELQDALNFVFWADDGDNVLEEDEYAGGKGVWTGTAEEFMNTSPRIVADSTFNIFAAGAPNTPLTGGATYYIAKAWCFGDLGFNPVATDAGADPTVATGITCDGAALDNSTQTDGIVGNISFSAVQSRNNGDFVCEAESRPEMAVMNLENKDSGWSVIPSDDIDGTVTYSVSDSSFHGTVVGQGLEANGYYQITLNGPTEASGLCTFTNTSLGNFGSNTFQSGFWNSAAPNLASTCGGNDEEGVYNMNLIGDHYTVKADGSGNINYPFSLNLPSGSYTGVKVLVKKMLDTHVSPWVDSATEHTTNLFETATINFTVL